MKAFINWLLGHEEESPEEFYNYLDRKLHNRDLFGKAIIKHINELPGDRHALAIRLIPALLELGSSSHPPSDLNLFIKSTHWERHATLFQQILDDWWQLLQYCVAFQKSTEESPVSPGNCLVDRCNLPAARAIVWLKIHLGGKAVMQYFPPFMANCLHAYPHCSETTQQLALSAANALVRQPFYPFLQHEIALNYPMLCKGRMGKRLQLQQMRRAS